MQMFFTLLMALSFDVHAVTTDLPKNEMIWSTADQVWLTLQEFREANVQAGDVLVLGEQHALGESPSEKIHHGNQHRLLFELARQHRVSLGMEFFDYPKQDIVDQYVWGQLPETDFLKQVGWGGNAWPLYRDQVKFAGATGGRTFALNIPRAISGKVARGGKQSLSADEQALLPPIWEVGSPFYFARFKEVMDGHLPPEMLERYFLAQSLWDDTMAWQISKNHRNGDDEVFVVIVGQFHAEFGHGLPSRLDRYGVEQVKTMIQVEVTDWRAKDLDAAVAADATYGNHADYIWVYQLPKN